MTVKILVAGIGNIFLGDDGFGPAVVRRLLGSVQDLWPDGVTVTDYGIRGMHLAYDLLAGYDVLVLIDAVPGNGAPGEITVLRVDPDEVGAGPLDAHGMDPVTVLRHLEPLGGRLPETYVVGCQPDTVREGIGLSDAVQAALPAAVESVSALLTERVASFEALASRRA